MTRRSGARRCVRWIGGREFLLAGRLDTREAAEREAAAVRRSWSDVRIRAGRFGLTFSIWVHGAKQNGGADG